jgi:hypothetical protein
LELLLPKHKVVVDNALRELLAYNDFYRPIRIDIARMWEERVGGEELNYAHSIELSHHYFDFLVAN